MTPVEGGVFKADFASRALNLIWMRYQTGLVEILELGDAQ